MRWWRFFQELHDPVQFILWFVRRSLKNGLSRKFRYKLMNLLYVKRHCYFDFVFHPFLWIFSPVSIRDGGKSKTNRQKWNGTEIRNAFVQPLLGFWFFSCSSPLFSMLFLLLWWLYSQTFVVFGPSSSCCPSCYALSSVWMFGIIIRERVLTISCGCPAMRVASVRAISFITGSRVTADFPFPFFPDRHHVWTKFSRQKGGKN